MRKREEYIYMDCKVRMSKSGLSGLTYAAIMTRSGLPTFFGVGIYENTWAQNCYNNVDVKVHIHPLEIERFEKIAGVKLTAPINPKPQHETHQQ